MYLNTYAHQKVQSYVKVTPPFYVTSTYIKCSHQKRCNSDVIGESSSEKIKIGCNPVVTFDAMTGNPQFNVNVNVKSTIWVWGM